MSADPYLFYCFDPVVNIQEAIIICNIKHYNHTLQMDKQTNYSI